MGILRNETTGSTWALVGRQLVGRSPACQLRLGSDTASQEHAVIWWEDGRWWVRDLGSTNGTTVSGRRVASGEQVELTDGATIELGDPAELWSMLGVRPPVARAVSLEEGEALEATDGLLGIPAEESPEIVLHERADGRWVLEDGGGARPVSNLDVVTALGRSWRLHLPEPAHATLGAAGRTLRLPDVALDFRVSRNEEVVNVTVRNEHASAELPSRTHSYALLLLARTRLADADLPPAERGWTDRDELCRQLAVDRLTLNTLVHRARRQLADAGVLEVGALVERRVAGAALRLGVADLTVGPLDG